MRPNLYPLSGSRPARCLCGPRGPAAHIGLWSTTHRRGLLRYMVGVSYNAALCPQWPLRVHFVHLGHKGIIGHRIAYREAIGLGRASLVHTGPGRPLSHPPPACTI